MRKYNPDIHHRTSYRRSGHDYHLACVYFITIKAHENTCLFGEIRPDGIYMKPSAAMLRQEWHALRRRFTDVIPAAFIVMPDHVHGILTVTRSEETFAGHISLSGVVQAYKSLTTRRYSDGVREAGWEPYDGKVWQRNFNDRIVRSEAECRAYERYIADNPRRRWEREFLVDPDSKLCHRSPILDPSNQPL